MAIHGMAALDAEGVDGDDVRVLEPGDDLGLAAEALGEALVLEELARQDLQGHVAVEAGLVGLVDRAMPPRPRGSRILYGPKVLPEARVTARLPRGYAKQRMIAPAAR